MNKKVLYGLIKSITSFLLCFIIGYLGGKLIRYENGSTIEKRYRALGIMKLDSISNTYVPKSDTLIITKWDLWYIQHGTTKGKGY
jgi:mannitol-specific phosphotransferase system IIBC component